MLALIILSNFSFEIKAQDSNEGTVNYKVYDLLSKDYSTIQEETNNGQDRIIITGIFPSSDEIKAGLLQKDWCVNFEEIELKKLKFGGGSLCINLDEKTITGEASCEPDFLDGVSIAGSFKSGRNGIRDISLVGDELGIPIGTTPAMLQKIGASLMDLHKNPGWSVTGNLGISIGKKKIADEWPLYVDSYATWQSNGYLEISSELQIIGITTGVGLLSYTPPESEFYAEAWMDIYGGLFRGIVQLNARPKYFNGYFGMTVQIPEKIPVIGGINFGSADVDMTITDKYWEVGAGVFFQLVPDVPQVCIPRVCSTIKYPVPKLKCKKWKGCKYKTKWKTKTTCTPESCTPAISNSWSRAKFNVRYHSQNGLTSSQNGRLTKMYNDNLLREKWENPLVSIVMVPEQKAYAVFNDNWDILYESIIRTGQRNILKQSPLVKIIEVDENLDTAIFRMSYEKEVEDIDLVMITPDGIELDIHEGPMPFGYKTGAKGTGTFNPKSKEAYYLLKDVKKGNYKMVIGNPNPLGEKMFELAMPNSIPQLYGAVASKSSARDGSLIPNQYEVDWAYYDKDETQNTTVSFFVDKDRHGYDGFYVGGGLISDMDWNQSFTFLTDSLGLRPGWYYTYVEINDGRNLPERIYSDERIFIDMDQAPDSVEKMATLSGPNCFIIEWEAVEDDRVQYYNVVCSKKPTFEKIEHSEMIYPNFGQTKFKNIKIPGLKNGVPYYVAVLSVDKNFVESNAKVIHRVVPTDYPGGTPPSIISNPHDKATVGYEWSYRPKFFDGDEHNPEILEDLTDSIRTEIFWTLDVAPHGMEIDNESGLINWKPDVGQEGFQQVVISAREVVDSDNALENDEFTVDVNGHVATQEFKLNVFPENIINGVPYRENIYDFLSDPPLTAIRGSNYLYTPKVFTDGQKWELMLLNGPDGVSIEDNIVKWEVQPDAESDFIELRAETESGDIVEQSFFVHVHDKNIILKRKTEIVDFKRIDDGFLIGWIGTAPSYMVQSTSSLTPNDEGIVIWEDLTGPIENSPVNFHVEKDKLGETLYYRIKDIN